MIRDIGVSILLTVVVSLVVASAGHFIFQADMLRVGVSVFLLQIMGFYLWNSLLQVLAKNNLERQETERVKVYEQQGVTVKCAYCGKPNYIPIRMDQENEFECEHCGKKNSIYVDIVVAQQTEILERDPFTISSTNNKPDGPSEENK